jgi:hypothetical protein
MGVDHRVPDGQVDRLVAGRLMVREGPTNGPPFIGWD